MQRQDYLDTLTKKNKLTRGGEDWLRLALDPFHDFNRTIAGYPDTDGSQTLVSCYQYQYDLTVPANVNGNWDAHIFTLPVLESLNYNNAAAGVEFNDYTLDAAASQAPVGPLVIRAGAAGSALQPQQNMPANTTHACLPALNSEDLQKGITRILGMGFEVTNTTADMYKQGAVTVYRMPQYRSVPAAVALERPAHRGVVSSIRLRDAPSTIAQINLLKGTRTWSASEGCYVTAAFSDVSNPLLPPNPNMIVVDREGSHEIASTALISPYTVQGAANAPPTPSLLVVNATQTAPMDTSGAYFTGLSNSTTLTVKLKVYIERAPTHTEADLAVLATPSAGLDTRALEIYSRAITQLPVGVTVAENGIGDWFRTVMSVVRKVAPTVGGVISAYNPAAGELIRTAGKVAGNFDDLVKKKTLPRKKSQKMPPGQKA